MRRLSVILGMLSLPIANAFADADSERAKQLAAPMAQKIRAHLDDSPVADQKVGTWRVQEFYDSDAVKVTNERTGKTYVVEDGKIESVYVRTGKGKNAVVHSIHSEPNGSAMTETISHGENGPFLEFVRKRTTGGKMGARALVHFRAHDAREQADYTLDFKNARFTKEVVQGKNALGQTITSVTSIGVPVGPGARDKSDQATRRLQKMVRKNTYQKAFR